MTDDRNQPSWRKPVGMALILMLIAFWSWAAVSLVEALGDIHPALTIALYAVAGIAWIAPLKPLLAWMETGRIGAIPDE